MNRIGAPEKNQGVQVLPAHGRQLLDRRPVRATAAAAVPAGEKR